MTYSYEDKYPHIYAAADVPPLRTTRPAKKSVNEEESDCKPIDVVH